ncbi:MAG: ABC transporter permease [Verrucomicrobiota bacterium]|nr:ABC transporter permease [Limisphaera sp.]MDW8383093.1 ABC transporter permease [Verrucomicrobiota bacterium]
MKRCMALTGVVIRELYRRKDFYVLFVLTALITLLLASIQFFEDLRMVRYLREVTLLLIWISALVIAVVTAARQIPAERESRTIFPLLAKPVSRGEVVMGKFLGVWLATGLALAVFYGFYLLVGTFQGAPSSWLLGFQAFWLHWMMLAVVVSMAILGSLLFSAPSVNSTLCFIVVTGILLLAGHLNIIAGSMPGLWGALLYGLYFALPHLELFDVRDLLIHEHPPVAWGAFAVAGLYAAVYTTLFLIAAWWLFRKKPLST